MANNPPFVQAIHLLYSSPQISLPNRLPTCKCRYIETCSQTTIYPLFWANYALIYLSLAFPSAPFKSWWLNSFFLKHDPSKSGLETALQCYFIENVSPDISPYTLWEVHKSVIQGHCTALATTLKKKTKAARQFLTALDKLRQIESSPP